MGKYRAPSENSKYYIPKEDYLTAIHYSLRYPLWKEEVETMADTSKGISYDKDKVQTSFGYDSTFEAAVKIMDSGKDIEGMLIGAVSRNGKIIIPNGSSVIEAGDTLYVVGLENDIYTLNGNLRAKKLDELPKRVMIAGGGKSGLFLANSLKKKA